MPINLDEKLLPLSEVAKYVPRRNGKKVHISTLYRWSTTGCRGVLLETIQVGATRVSSREAVIRFIQELTAAAHRNRTAERDDATHMSARSVLRVEKQLDDAGL